MKRRTKFAQRIVVLTRQWWAFITNSPIHHRVSPLLVQMSETGHWNLRWTKRPNSGRHNARPWHGTTTLVLTEEQTCMLSITRTKNPGATKGIQTKFLFTGNNSAPTLTSLCSSFRGKEACVMEGCQRCMKNWQWVDVWMVYKQSKNMQ